MARIHILDSETIDKIAAGEVVERPSSVVKELVENAIDAGATAITVEAKDGGIELIRVTDNGCGMEREQLRTAFLRHATSKIENANDLTRISSLGFRGEALSSIAAVAKVEVATKVQNCMTGSRILLEGAKEVAFDEVGVPDGTTFIVRNLFFNTPVRRKFLKQPATEGGYIAALMEHLALSRPDVSIKLLLGNQMKFHTSGNGDLREVIYRIYGREIAGALVPIQAEKNGLRIEGYLGKPVQVRSNRNFEIYFINGRFIRSNVISKAVEEGYKEYLMQHKFPLCVLHITMEPSCVDVNVHPTKMDVRFSDPIGFCDFLTGAVRQTLRHKEMIPEASLSTERELRAARMVERKEKEAKDTPEPFEQKRSNAYRVMEEAQYAREKPKTRDFTNNPVWNRVKSNSAMDEEPFHSAEMPKGPNGIPASVPKDSVLEEDFFIETSELTEPNSDISGLAERNPGISMLAGQNSGISDLTKLNPEIQGSEPTKVDVSGKRGTLTDSSAISEEDSMAQSGKKSVNYFDATGENRTDCPKGTEERGIKYFEVPENNGIRLPGLSEDTRVGIPEVSEDTGVRIDSAKMDGLRNDNISNDSTKMDNMEKQDVASFQITEGVQMDLFEDKILTMDNRSRFRMIGQVFETYWLIEFENNLLMIDQHAAHEKVNYERLMKQYHEKTVASQNLLPPVIVSLSGQEEMVLKEHRQVFQSLGFEIEDFGGSEYALRSVPVDLYGCNEQEMFLEVLEGLANGSTFKSTEAGNLRVIEEKIASMSCKAAVKGNNRLSFPEAEALIDELLTLENPYHCPHGRPTIVTMTKMEMDRKFKRIVN